MYAGFFQVAFWKLGPSTVIIIVELLLKILLSEIT